MVQRRSMKMGRNMKRDRGRRGGTLDANGNEIPDENGVTPGVQPEQVQTPVNTGSWMPDFLSSSGDKAKDLLGETKTLTDNAGSYLKGLMPGSSAGSDTQVVSVANGTGAPKKEDSNVFGSFFGGKRRRRSMKMRGGLNQAFGYNAAPVTDANSAEPTYMIKGGRRRRRTCKKKRKCCKKSCRKRHRHIHRK
jgi:hypothetical protein